MINSFEDIDNMSIEELEEYCKQKEKLDLLNYARRRLRILIDYKVSTDKGDKD